MTGTKRLHYEDPLALDAGACVLAHETFRDAPSVVLDRTPFYPESGGQLADRGVLRFEGGEVRVRDAQLDPEGRVHHLVEGTPPPVGAEVEAHVEGVRRRVHMALHSGQHALSRALLDTLGAVTVSSRLGASACTLDVDVDRLSLDDVRRAEDVVNRVIDEDRPIESKFVNDAELATLDLRKPPTVSERVRVVVIDGFDITPCGGTHATHTAQIELLRIGSVERYKGGTRITFEAGPRARSALGVDSDRLREAARVLGCAPAEVSAILEGQRAKLDAATREAGLLRTQLAEAWAGALPDARRVFFSVDGGDAALLKAIAQRAATGDRVLVLTAPVAGATHLLVACGPDADEDAGALLRNIAEAHGGRGGGRKALAQGRLPEGISAAELNEGV
ncbi:MAG: alanine--tRNA ligase-related protein [Sandaracinaceae bacterium]